MNAWLWLCLYAGYGYYVYRRATLVAKSSPSVNPIRTRLAWIVHNRAAIIVNGLCTGALHVFLSEAPAFIGTLFGIPNLAVPKALLHPVVLPLLGFFATTWIDGQLEKYPRFKSEMPRLNGA